MFDGVISGPVAVLVPSGQFGRWSAHVWRHLEKMAAGSHGRYFVEDIASAISDGRMQLWVCLAGSDILAVLLTEIVQFPRKKACRFIGLYGREWRRWMHFRHDVATWAKSMGCDEMQVLGLPRVKHLVPDYSIDHVLLARDI